MPTTTTIINNIIFLDIFITEKRKNTKSRLSNAEVQENYILFVKTEKIKTLFTMLQATK